MTIAKYSTLIRTFNSQRSLPATLQALQAQTHQPSRYIIVDSGSTDRTLLELPPDSLVHRFVGTVFNYSEALNQGVDLVSTDLVLIISSHTVLENPVAIEQAIRVLESNPNIGAAYMSDDNVGPLRHEVIDENNFNGFNGLWNSCSLVRVELLRMRPFRTDVFTAEDQEWARWLIAQHRMTVARIAGARMFNRNPRSSSLRKRANEYVSVAYFTNRKLLSWPNLLRVGFGVVTPRVRVTIRERIYKAWLLVRLIKCHFGKPIAESRYF
jgi:glycosyltransferase involved in cell wall biosynthesis